MFRKCRTAPRLLPCSWLEELFWLRHIAWLHSANGIAVDTVSIMTFRSFWLASFVCSVAAACDTAPPARPQARAAQNEPAMKAELTAHPRVTMLRGPSAGAPIAPFIAQQLRQHGDHTRALLVYVGASWCEPCQRFHAAAESGALDETLAGVRVIEFDYDADEPALRGAGYVSRLIPLFAIPKPDGTASERMIEGSIKGPDAVARNLVPRLAALLSTVAQVQTPRSPVP